MADKMTTAFPKEIDKGLWYRRKDGRFYAAERIGTSDLVSFTALHPNTLEPMGKPHQLPVEHFYCFFCRQADL